MLQTPLLQWFKVIPTVFPCKPLNSTPVAPNGVELAKKLWYVEKYTVAQLFYLLLQASSLDPENPFLLQELGTAAFGITAWSIVGSRILPKCD